MRVVVDTNVVVSAILRDGLPERILLFILGRNDLEWVASSEILSEYREVLKRPKFALPISILEKWEKCFKSAIAEWPVDFSVSFPRDIKDAKFLACAMASEADFFITGDRDFSEVVQLGSTKIISLRLFETLVRLPLDKSN